MTDSDSSTQETPQADSISSGQPQPADFLVAGIGASAGGLEALEAFFENTSADWPIAYVVVQHLSPDFKSHMEELLSRKTKLPVYLAEEGLKVEPNHIYLIPAKTKLTIDGGRLKLQDREPSPGLSQPIDHFLDSLANDCGSRAVGIILSGTGSDGSRGVVSVRQAGGLVIAQSPESAKFDGMPIAAQTTGVVCALLRPEEMPGLLAQYEREGRSVEGLQRARSIDSVGDMGQVYRALRRISGIDFSHYKLGTIERRLRRRMERQRIASIPDYCDYLERHSEEVDSLGKDLLIGVTQFFRDDEVFDRVAHEIVPRLVAGAGGQTEIRVWVAGCASGEEAYSIAMLLDEQIRREDASIDFKIFATDVHPGALKIAGQGRFSEPALGNVSKERRQRYFTQTGDGYQVARDLRDKIVFAKHNVFEDAPFTNLDLVSCRNLLIYLLPGAQQKAISLFHFALKLNGVLVLGSSETPGELAEEFDTIDARLRIYCKRRNIKLPSVPRLAMKKSAAVMPYLGTISPAPTSVSLEQSLRHTYDELLEEFMPPSALVSENYSIIHLFGGAAKFISLRDGRMSVGLLEVVDPALRTAVAGALQHALHNNKVAKYANLLTSNDERVDLLVLPKQDPASKVRTLLVQFVQLGKSFSNTTSKSQYDEYDLNEANLQRLKSLEDELHHSRENLQATIEELETSNEELQATNEELLASNEELQSTNEELQSVNEELFTVNTEHNKKIEEVTGANADMDNLLEITRVGVLYLDRELRIRRYTPEMSRILHLLPQDIGRSIEGFSTSLQSVDLGKVALEALSNNAEIERRVSGSDAHAYLLRTAPYVRLGESRGVVITLVDIQELDRSTAAAEQFRHASQQSHDGQLIVSRAGELIYANQAATDLLALPLDDHARTWQTLMSKLPALYQSYEIFRHEGSRAIESDFCVIEHTDRGKVSVEVDYSVFETRETMQLFVSLRDITRRQLALEGLHLYRSAMDAAHSGIAIADAKQKDLPLIYVNPAFCEMTGYAKEEVLGRNCRFLNAKDSSPEVRLAIREAISRGVAIRRTVRNQRRNGIHFWNDLSLSPVHNADGEVSFYVGVQHDVSARVNDVTLAVNREADVRALIDSAAEGILGIDPTGKCTFCNEFAVELLGYASNKEIIGRDIHPLLHSADGELDKAECEICQAIVAGQTFQKKEVTLYRRDSSSFVASQSMRPLIQDGLNIGFVFTFDDITERKEAEEALRQAIVRADAASRAKSEFFANVSHELRTPLSVISTYAEVIRSGPEASRVTKPIDAIQRNTKFMIAIIDDILDMAKLEAEQIELEARSTDVREIIEDIKASFEPRAVQGGIAFQAVVEESAPKVISTDPLRFRQILVNLVGNAIKFTAKGSVQIIATGSPKGLRVLVRDTGIGMSKSELQRIFEPFQQASEEVASKYGGTGLGLGICRRLSRHLGGTITADSTPGVGSTFTVELPLSLPRSAPKER